MLWELFISCLRVGAFTFGGGYAMLPVMQDIFVREKHWLTEEEFVDMVSLVQITPGAVAVNASIYIGRKLAGFPGAIVATLGSVLPSFLIIYIIASSLMNFYQSPLVIDFFKGVRPAIAGLILVAGLKIGHDSLVSKLAKVLTVFFGLLAFFLNIHPIILILAGAVSGALLGLGGKKL